MIKPDNEQYLFFIKALSVCILLYGITLLLNNQDLKISPNIIAQENVYADESIL